MIKKKLQSFLDKLYIKQWAVGVAKFDINLSFPEFISNLNFTWIKSDLSTRFYADPFVLKSDNGNINVFYEDYSFYDQYGKVSISILDKDFNLLHQKIILDTKSHLSYPSIYKKEGYVYLIPESSKEGSLFVYEFDQSQTELINKRTVISNEPLLDSTIFFHNGKYWLFATKRGANSNNELFLYYSDTWDKNFIPHPCNPVKNSLKGSRPAGAIFIKNGELFRPTQNSEDYYGKSIIINKIITLTENKFEESQVFELKSPKNTEYNFAIHTINFDNDVIVVDGLKRIFNPFIQLKIFILKSFKI